MQHKKTTSNQASRSSHVPVSAAITRTAARSFSSQQPVGSEASENNNDFSEGEVEVDQELYTHGATRCPPVPTREEDKIVLVPVGDKQWREKNFGDKSRVPNGILRAIIKEHFPGTVKFNGRDEPCWSWRHYELVPDNPKRWQQRLPSLLHRVEEDFWLYFRWAEGTENAARRVVHNVVKDSFSDVFYEARIQSVIDYHVLILKKPIERSEACRKYLTVAQYMKAKPWWAQKTPEAWKLCAELRWCNEEWIKKSCEGRVYREMMDGPAHRQGSASLDRFQKNMEKKEKRPVSIFEAYAEARKSGKDGEDYCTDRVKDKLEAYFGVLKEKHGARPDLMKEPIDGATVHKAGGGKKHGRFLIADGYINTAEVLAEARRCNFDLPNDERPHRRLRLDVDHVNRIEHLENQLQQEREDRQREREEREQEKEREREEREREKEREREERQRERDITYLHGTITISLYDVG